MIKRKQTEYIPAKVSVYKAGAAEKNFPKEDLIVSLDGAKRRLMFLEKRMKNNSLNYKKNNKGFSLFAVIVAIAFTGILGMLVVYIAMSNFYMKITDWKGKDSFYTAEQAIEEIRVGLQEVAGDAMSEAYVQVLEEYEGKSDSDTPQDEERQLMFCKLFYTRLNDKLQEILNSSNPVTDSILQDKYVDLKVGENETLQIVDPGTGGKSGSGNTI